MDCGTDHYKHLLDQYPRVTAAFLRLDVSYQEVIADVTRRMGRGMAEYIQKEVRAGLGWAGLGGAGGEVMVERVIGRGGSWCGA